MLEKARGKKPRTPLSWGTTVALLSLVSAAAVGVPFLPQPLLELMRADYNNSLSEMGIVATSAQVGAALGILFLVPLADVVRPRVHLTIQLSVCALALAAAAWAPSVLVLCGTVGVGALCSVVAQIILPIALREAPEGKKARTAATLGASLLFGIFGSRLLAGVLGAEIGWQATLQVYAGVLVLACVGAWFALSSLEKPTSKISYTRLLISIPKLAARDSALVLSAIAQGLTFAAFNAQWSVMASYLMQKEDPWTASQAGLVNLIGIGAGVLAVSAGPLVARIGPSRTLWRALPILIAGALFIAFFHSWLIPALIALLILSAANQVGHVANQTEALLHHHDSAGRANTVYMFGTMLGGGAGAAVGTSLFPTSGLFGVALFSATAGLGALLAVLLRDLLKLRRVRVS